MRCKTLGLGELHILATIHHMGCFVVLAIEG